jgi:transcriptional regulator with XRE-family HTH domain
MTAPIVVPLTDTPMPPAPAAPSALQATNTPLGRARVARGWSQHKVVRALIVLADHWDWDIAAETSLKVQLSRWENDVVRPCPTYQVLLCAVFRTTPEELGFTRQASTVTRAALADRVRELEDLVNSLADRLGEVAA